jgi:hypothetical protein
MDKLNEHLMNLVAELQRIQETAKAAGKLPPDVAEAVHMKLAAALRTATEAGDLLKRAIGADVEQYKVEQHFDGFSETFRKLHTTKKEFVGAFNAARKLDPTVTAEKFLAAGRGPS